MSPSANACHRVRLNGLDREQLMEELDSVLGVLDGMSDRPRIFKNLVIVPAFHGLNTGELMDRLHAQLTLSPKK